VPGVIDVNGWGGKSKIYEVAVDLNKLNDTGLTLAQVIQALNNNDQNVGGDTLNVGPHAVVVRGVTLIQSIDAIRDTIVSANNGAPILIRDIADVAEGYRRSRRRRHRARHRLDASRRADDANDPTS
jgi:cobalt-zinc-cadmium resistance protein CzcA